jgi:hypothetical protein
LRQQFMPCTARLTRRRRRPDKFPDDSGPRAGAHYESDRNRHVIGLFFGRQNPHHDDFRHNCNSFLSPPNLTVAGKVPPFGAQAPYSGDGMAGFMPQRDKPYPVTACSANEVCHPP